VSRQLNAKCPSYFDHRVEARLCARGERLIETLSAKAGIACYLGHATGTSDITQCEQQMIKVACLQHGTDVFGDSLVVSEITCSVEGKKLSWCFCFAHGSNSSSLAIL